jgi:Zn-dependent metalloprotease
LFWHSHYRTSLHCKGLGRFHRDFHLLTHTITYETRCVMSRSLVFKIFPITLFLLLGLNGILAQASDYNEVLADPNIRQVVGSPLHPSETSTLKFDSNIEGKRTETKKYQHFYRGLEVVGSMSMRHQGPNGVQITDRLAHFDLDTKPTVSPDEALSLAMIAEGEDDPQNIPELKILPSLSGEGSARLVYFVHLRKQVIVDAQTGEIVALISPEENLVPIDIYSAEGTGKVIPEPSYNRMKKTDKVTFVASQCQIIDQITGDPFLVNPTYCNAGNDASAQRATSYAQTVLNYYQDTFNRNSYDGNGATVIGVVHSGFKYNNALWNTETSMIAYGDGDGITFGDFTEALDVTGHELTHGITAATAKLLMIGESGAINEAFSDFFGRMIANDGLWSMGKSLFIDPNALGLRDLQNPASISFTTKDKNGVITHTGTYPAHIAQMVKVNPGEKCDIEANDNCFVHINSTILSHASYLVYQAIGKEKAQELYFTVLTQKLTATSTIRSAAQSVVDACALLFDETTCSQVITAYTDVGISTARAAAVTNSDSD